MIYRLKTEKATEVYSFIQKINLEMKDLFLQHRIFLYIQKKKELFLCLNKWKPEKK
jgi:hypothetical protein